MSLSIVGLLEKSRHSTMWASWTRCENSSYAYELLYTKKKDYILLGLAYWEQKPRDSTLQPQRPHSSQQSANGEAKSSKCDANGTSLDRRNGSGVFKNAFDESSPVTKKMESDAPSGDKNASGAASEEGCWQARRCGWYSSSTRSMTYLVRCKWWSPMVMCIALTCLTFTYLSTVQ